MSVNAAFLDALFAIAPADTFVNVSGWVMNGDGYAVDETGGRIWTDKVGAYPVSDVGHLEVPQVDRWFTVHPRVRPSRGSEDNTAVVVAVVADFDFADSSDGKDPEHSFTSLAGVERFCRENVPLEPSAMIESGHGVHVYWFLVEALDPREGKALLVRFNASLQAQAKAVGKSLDSMKDLARVMQRQEPRRPPPCHRRRTPPGA